VIVGGNGDSIFQRLMRAVGRADLAVDPRLADNPGRVQHEAEIDTAIEAFTSTRPYPEVERALMDAEVPVGPIYSIADIATDPQYLARSMFHEVTLPDGSPLRVPAQVPKLSLTPGQTEWAGPTLGEHNESIYRELLGLTAAQLAELARTTVI
jgi:crotonobetainyl-CoA:carnitine CoA-transferase CaiB-like acyl-CoA transferase